MKRFTPFFVFLSVFLSVCVLAGCIHYLPREDSTSGTVAESPDSSDISQSTSDSSGAVETPTQVEEPESGWSRRY